MPKILLVEDDEKWQKIFEHLLKGLGGTIDKVTFADDAIKKLEDTSSSTMPYDACILDTMIPQSENGLPGYTYSLELAIEITKKGIRSERIFMVGYTIPFVVEQARELGIQNFYFKEKGQAILGQKHYIQIRVDLARILR